MIELTAKQKEALRKLPLKPFDRIATGINSKVLSSLQNKKLFTGSIFLRGIIRNYRPNVKAITRLLNTNTRDNTMSKPNTKQAVLDVLTQQHQLSLATASNENHWERKRPTLDVARICRHTGLSQGAVRRAVKQLVADEDIKEVRSHRGAMFMIMTEEAKAERAEQKAERSRLISTAHILKRLVPSMGTRFKGSPVVSVPLDQLNEFVALAIERGISGAEIAAIFAKQSNEDEDDD